ncbi:MAG: peptidylprolyl isomerase [Clostridia bacterium]|nr:peptidylprolyl isomerase [Clostridia bacterium]
MSFQTSLPVKGDTVAVMHTNMGDIKIKLFGDKAPKTVENFTTHAKNGYYNGLIFHRVINDFMIQGGDPTGTGMGGESIWGHSFEDEFSPELHNIRGALCMANAGPNTNGSQFFIVQASECPAQMLSQMKQIGAEGGFTDDVINDYETLGGTPWLDYRHSVFGYVYEGMDVVDDIARVKVGPNDKPMYDVTIDVLEIITVE